jgi:radical SAM superfamily enzyme YgiQ (UPF0313 family)
MQDSGNKSMKHILAINPAVLCVNECQREWYSFAHPTSLLKIAAYHKRMGNSIQLIDCMEYENEWNQPLDFYKKLPIGTRDLNLYIDTYILGRSFSWLERELGSYPAPDEIWISCHLTCNAALAHQTIIIARKVFPGIPVVFGGNYPTLFPEEARQSGAKVYVGRLPEATLLFPDYSVFEGVPDYFVFQLALGCENHCSHCVNHLLGPMMRMDIDALVKDMASKVKAYGIRRFINIDPNVAACDLEAFLKQIINRRLDVELYFYGGIQPDRVTRPLVRLMKQANVKGISLPRELNQPLNKRLGKKYEAEDFHKALDLFAEEGFDLSFFHCPFPVGLRDDNLADIFKIIKEIKDMGAIAEISPISYVPGTPEYDRHFDLLEGKNLEELNWALWPTLSSNEKIQAYATLYNLAHNNRFHEPWQLDHSPK